MILEEYTPETQAKWDAWVATLPANVQEVAKRLPPNRLYLLKSSGHRVTLRSYNDNGSVSVDVTGRFNRVIFGRTVFGVLPEDLEECDGPAAGEDVGDTAAEANFSDEDITNILIPAIKAKVSESTGGCRGD